MKIWIRIIMIVALMMSSSHAHGKAIDEYFTHDTLYFYTTWQQIMDYSPVAMIIDPVIDAFSPYEVYIESGVDKVNEKIMNDYIAFSQGDSIWLINGEYVKQYFNGDVKNIDGYAPFYFNEKTAFIVAPRPLTVKDILMGNDREGYTTSTPEYYYIDFMNRRVNRVTPEYLSKLLEDYHDLQMRYEGMKDYKKSYIIEDYFYKFIDRASDDFMRPYILDLVE